MNTEDIETQEEERVRKNKKNEYQMDSESKKIDQNSNKDEKRETDKMEFYSIEVSKAKRVSINIVRVIDEYWKVRSKVYVSFKMATDIM